MTTTETPVLETAEGYRSAATFNVRTSENGRSVLEITFARFNQWVEIKSYREGRFLERLTPGAFKDTMAERAHLIRCLFDHGKDPSIGNKTIGKPMNFRETEVGPTVDVELFDERPFVQDLVPGLQAVPPTYGASYRFGIYRRPANGFTGEVVGEEWNHNPGKSAHNPEGLPERTITRVNMSEMGPVTFAADEGTQDHLAMRSLTDRFSDQERNVSEELAAGVPEPDAQVKTNDREARAMAYGMAERRRSQNDVTQTSTKGTRK